MFVYGAGSIEGSGAQNAINSIKDLIRYFNGEELGVVHGTAGRISDTSKNEKLMAGVRNLAEKIVSI
jgi:hypothetical protein